MSIREPGSRAEPTSEPEAPVVKSCSCGRTFTDAEWQRLHRRPDAVYPWGEVQEMRLCSACRSALVRIVVEGRPSTIPPSPKEIT